MLWDKRKPKPYEILCCEKGYMPWTNVYSLCGIPDCQQGFKVNEDGQNDIVEEADEEAEDDENSNLKKEVRPVKRISKLKLEIGKSELPPQTNNNGNDENIRCANGYP
jgi:hypothetical protein